MNRKILLTVLVLVVVLLATPFIGMAHANRGQNKKEWKSYDLEGILLEIADSTTTQNGPIVIIDGTRLPAGVVEMTATIDGITYSYPEDFDYSEHFHLELNVATTPPTGTLTVETVLTFNLPGNPEIKEWIVAGTTPAMGFSGTFQLSGTKMFNKVEGEGPDVAVQKPYGSGMALYASHIGLIKGWPFGE